MGPTRLSKFRGTSDDDGTKLHWGRADMDGAPFRGQPQMLNEKEYSSTVVKVLDPKNGHFDLTDEEQNKQYLAVCDKIQNKRAILTFIQRMITPATRTVYIEWAEPFMQHANPKMK